MGDGKNTLSRNPKDTKKMSRKARSKPDTGSASQSATASPAGFRLHSKPNSKANSRVGSRYNSEDDVHSDEMMTISTLSLGSDDSLDEPGRADWQDRLNERILELQERKGTSTQGREMMLAGYVHLLRYHYARSEVEPSYGDIVSALMRSVKTGGSAKERAAALTALTLTVVTAPSATLFDQVAATLKNVCQDDEDEQVKLRAMHALVVTAVFGGGSESDWNQLALFLLTIVESDGRAVGADDSAAIVVAALESWAFIVSKLPEVVDQSQQALDAFIEQLDSTDAEVQVSAGSNLALLYEKARIYNAHAADSEDDDDDEEEEPKELYDLDCDMHQLIAQMTAISRQSSKSISKKDKRTLKSKFTSIVTSLEQGKGPGYAVNGRPILSPHTGGRRLDTDGDIRSFGHRQTIRFHDNILTIDSWSASARADFMRDVLGGGLGEHYDNNPDVADVFNGVSVRDVSRKASPDPAPGLSSLRNEIDLSDDEAPVTRKSRK
jgi:hypothetical protein